MIVDTKVGCEDHDMCTNETVSIEQFEVYGG